VRIGYIREKNSPGRKFQIKYEGRRVDFRVGIVPTIHGERAVLRLLDSSSLNLSLGDLGFEPSAYEAFQRAINASYGMVLVTGPTGAGKQQHFIVL